MSNKTDNKQRGIALLIALLLMSVLLGVSASLLNVTLKQFQLSGIARDSEMAFQAANAGIECIGYWDNSSGLDPFKVNGDGKEQSAKPTISCMDVLNVQAMQVDTDTSNGNVAYNGKMASGEEQRFQFSWGDPEVCTDVSVYKFKENAGFDGDSDGPNMASVLGKPGTCPEDVECTVVRSRGYNSPCGAFNKGTLEREITQRY